MSQSLALRPDDRDLLVAGAVFARDARLGYRALVYARTLRARLVLGVSWT